MRIEFSKVGDTGMMEMKLIPEPGDIHDANFSAVFPRQGFPRGWKLGYEWGEVSKNGNMIPALRVFPQPEKEAPALPADLMGKTANELLEIAVELGVGSVSNKQSKAQMIALIMEARAKKAPDA